MTAVKKCPQCAEEVRSEAKICRFCRYTFTDENHASSPASTTRTANWLIIGLLTLGGVWFCASLSQPTTSNSVTDLTEATNPFSISEPTLLGANQLDEAAVQASISAHCADRYPADYTMRAACERNAADGVSDFGKIWNRHLADTSMLAALSNCHERYTNSGITDWSMAGACARNNEEGYGQVND